MLCCCGHEMIEIYSRTRAHYEQKSGKITEECSKCNCKKAILDESG